VPRRTTRVAASVRRGARGPTSTVSRVTGE
jgi:hypothetical protein